MSRSGAIELKWADGLHAFRLAYGELRELQEKCDAGPMFVLTRLETGSWLVDDVVETIRLGLIGGGAEALDALRLVERYVKDRPAWLLNVKVAQAVLGAALLGVKDEPLGKGEAGDEEATKPNSNRSSEESGVSPESTGTPSSPASPREPSTT